VDSATRMPTENRPSRPESKALILTAAPKRAVGCSKPSSCNGTEVVYGEPAGEMGVEGVALSSLARRGLTAFDLCTLTGKTGLILAIVKGYLVNSRQRGRKKASVHRALEKREACALLLR